MRFPNLRREGVSRPEDSQLSFESSSSAGEKPNSPSRPSFLNYSQWSSYGRGLKSLVRMTGDGRLSISLHLKNKLPEIPSDARSLLVVEDGVDPTAWSKPPALQIVIFLVGSRGDIQPYIALAKLLKADGHRIRIATHETFSEFVREHGLEFFSIGGNPHDLMSYMVKNPGLIPGMESLRNGDIPKKRLMLSEMIQGCWESCYSPDQSTGALFAADAIISNPPAFAHVHCAEALGIPLLMSFTMPWTSTTSFHHPLVQISKSNAGRGLTNALSFALAEILTWQGMGDLVNNFRTKTLGLRPLDFRSGPGVLERCKVPWTYCMSPALVPKPADWNNNMDVAGFYFLDLATNYTPSSDLAEFLAAGDAPIYIGFGSVVIEDPEAMTRIIFEATELAGVRALVSAGWGGLGGMTIPQHIFILGNVPHDWLFSNNRVKAVIHHGGAGTTAIGLAHGRPTAVVPFFGDQEFWGKMIARAGAGPEPIPRKILDTKKLTEAIEVLVSVQARDAAERIAHSIRTENGTTKGVESLYRHLPLLNMRCDVDDSRAAVWWDSKRCLKLSAFAAQILAEDGRLSLWDLQPHRTREYNPSSNEFMDPITGGIVSFFWVVTHSGVGLAELFYSPLKGIVHTTIVLPRGFIKILNGLHEGFRNAPRLYGSEIREKPQIKSFKHGIVEGGKSLWYGTTDPVIGLVRDPYRGARAGGLPGFLKESCRSYLNFGLKPFGGFLGFVVYPMKGIWRSGQTLGELIFARQEASQQGHQEVRRKMGIIESASCSIQERTAVIKTFSKLTKAENVMERKVTLRQKVERALKTMGAQIEEGGVLEGTELGGVVSQAGIPEEEGHVREPPSTSLECLVLPPSYEESGISDTHIPLESHPEHAVRRSLDLSDRSFSFPRLSEARKSTSLLPEHSDIHITPCPLPIPLSSPLNALS
ncbi:UDP-Glycosyltransferase/glycogen phosphorylase [Flagelloscypha sp. PMI_526]|nr:UDP-Glycosyltransferase/glycogen phosphorylase [Flagelloscypha sp. PMI_526]